MQSANGKPMHRAGAEWVSPVGVSFFSSLCRAAIATAQPSLTKPTSLSHCLCLARLHVNLLEDWK